MNIRHCIPITSLFVSLAYAQAAEIRIHLDNPPERGRVVFMLFDSPNAFGDLRDPVSTVSEPLDGRPAYVLTNVPPGKYALMAFVDENTNEQIDKNFIGIPREPLGFSNNYAPKGPPSYANAAFTLTEGQFQQFDLAFYKPLGKLGRIGIGPGVIWRSSPYRDYDGAVYQFIPAVTYTGERLQWFGPRVQFGLVGSGRVRLAATGEYRIGPYEENGSPFLDGMGDAEDAFMAGLALTGELPAGIDLSIGASTDAFGTIGGHEASARVGKLFQLGLLRITPGIGLNWMDEAMAANDFGVPAGKATTVRPAYAPGDVFGVEGGINLFIEISRNWLFAGSIAVEWLDPNATDSPIVEQHHVLKGFATINYIF